MAAGWGWGTRNSRAMLTKDAWQQRICTCACHGCRLLCSCDFCSAPSQLVCSLVHPLRAEEVELEAAQLLEAAAVRKRGESAVPSSRSLTAL